jgi:uncharacterized protein
MSIWAIADLHLSFGVPNKAMSVFGPQWNGYTEKIERSWRELVAPTDLVLIPGDISWAMSVEEARPDLAWIGQLPGTKLFLRGNHDYWWGSLAKIKPILPSSCHLLQNNSFTWEGVGIAGTRLWDVPGLSFHGVIDFKESKTVKKLTEQSDPAEAEKIFERELGRLEMSLKAISPYVKYRIAMTHYPPIGPDMKDTPATQLLEKYGIQTCVFGHMHNVKPDIPLFGKHNGIDYILTACDYKENFKPIKIL